MEVITKKLFPKKMGVAKKEFPQKGRPPYRTSFKKHENEVPPSLPSSGWLCLNQNVGCCYWGVAKRLEVKTASKRFQ